MTSFIKFGLALILVSIGLWILTVDIRLIGKSYGQFVEWRKENTAVAPVGKLVERRKGK